MNPLNRYDVELKARAKKIPNWTVDAKNAVNPLQPGPIKSGEPTETVTLIPMGAARLRIASFPLIATGAKGNGAEGAPPHNDAPAPASETPLLQMPGIRKSFPGVRALDGVDFSSAAARSTR